MIKEAKEFGVVSCRILRYDAMLDRIDAMGAAEGTYCSMISSGSRSKASFFRGNIAPPADFLTSSKAESAVLASMASSLVNRRRAPQHLSKPIQYQKTKLDPICEASMKLSIDIQKE